MRAGRGRRYGSRVRIAVFADVHGNLAAFEAVVEAIAAARVDEVLVGGDLVGRGPSGRRVVERVRDLGWPTLRGNHEEYLLAFYRAEVPPSWLHDEAWAASRWMAAELDEPSTSWIAGLPFSLNSRLDPQVEVVHGSPRSTQEGIGPWLDDRGLAEMVGKREGVLLCGHTHRPMVRQLGAGVVVNVGSVGLSFDGDRRACWALLERDGEQDSWRVQLERVDWDLEAQRRAYQSTGFAREGGVTAQLLWLEHETARPWLVPFLSWCEARGFAPRPDRVEAFREFYGPDASMRAFHERLAALRSGP